MSARLESRVRQLEQQLTLLRRELSQAVARQAAPFAPRQGFVLGALTTALAARGTATVRVIGFDAENWFYPDIEGIEAHDFFMNEDDDDYEADTKVLCMWYRNVWVVLYAWCDPSDTLPDESPFAGEGQEPEQFSEGNSALNSILVPTIEPGYWPQEAFS